MRIMLLSRIPEYKTLANILTAQGETCLFCDKKIDVAYLDEHRIEYLVSYCYGPIIKKPVIENYPRKIINVHNSYLPYGRGIYPILWSYFENTPKGITLHYIDEGIDTGDIIVQEEVSIKPNETLRSSHKNLAEKLLILFRKRFHDIVRESITPVRQKDLPVAGTYHDRKSSERLFQQLPQAWDTPVSQVQEIGKRFGKLDLWSEEFEHSLKAYFRVQKD